MSNAFWHKPFLPLGALGALVGAALIAWLTMRQAGPGSLLPHGYCFTWNPGLLWTHVLSDVLIGIAYFTIPLTLLHLVRRRSDTPFNGMVLLFATFIISCGATHWIDVWTVWNPDYWLSGSVKVITAIASMLTAGALIQLVPRALAIPTAAQMQAVNAALALEVQQRRSVEDELRQERAALEARVLERTQELELATAAAAQANLEKDRFLAKVSHELRTPLQSMLSWAEVLGHEKLDPIRAQQAAERIAHNVRRQARLIDDLLDISRILHGKLLLELEPADPQALIERAVEAALGTAAQRGVAIVVEAPTALLGSLLTDPARLEQVVGNLLSNAVQASQAGGTVWLNFSTQGDELEVRVRDEGVGLAAEQLPFIFEPFRQIKYQVSRPASPLSGQSTSRHGGLGLGLAIVRQIVTLLGGEITAASAGLGLGAEFLVRLPLHAAAAPPEATEAAEAADPDHLTAVELARIKGVRIVYVEDEDDIACSGALMLTTLGLQVRTCLSFDEALQRLAVADYDLLLTDLNLDKGHTGHDLLQALRRMPHGAHMPAVALSADGSHAGQRASWATGFAGHLVKPMNTVRLVRGLLAALKAQPKSV